MAAGSGSLRGNGTTFVLSSGAVGTIVDFEPGEESLAVIDDDGIAQTGAHQSIFGLRPKLGPDKLMAVFNPDALPTMDGTPLTGTLTFAPRTGQTVGATRAGTGAIISRKIGKLAIDERVLMEVSFQQDGKTGPTYTSGS